MVNFSIKLNCFFLPIVQLQEDVMFKQLKSIKCENCEDIVSNSNYAQHINSCKLYWKHMEKTPLGFKCNLCQFEKRDPKKSTIHQHLKTKHYNYIYFQKTNNEANVECELCEQMVKFSNYSDHNTSCRIQRIKKCAYCGVIIYLQSSFLSHFRGKYFSKRRHYSEQITSIKLLKK